MGQMQHGIAREDSQRFRGIDKGPQWYLDSPAPHVELQGFGPAGSLELLSIQCEDTQPYLCWEMLRGQLNGPLMDLDLGVAW
jgi:hypothetical protein